MVNFDLMSQLERMEHPVALLEGKLIRVGQRAGFLDKEAPLTERIQASDQLSIETTKFLDRQLGAGAVELLRECVTGVVSSTYINGSDLTAEQITQISRARFENYEYFRNWNRDFVVWWDNDRQQWTKPISEGTVYLDGKWINTTEGLSSWLERIDTGEIIDFDEANGSKLGPQKVRIRGENWEEIDTESAHRVVSMQIGGQDTVVGYVRLMRSDANVTVRDAISIVKEPSHPLYEKILPCLKDFDLDLEKLEKAPFDFLDIPLSHLAEMGRYNIVTEALSQKQKELSRMLESAGCSRVISEEVARDVIKDIKEYIHAFLMQLGAQETFWRDARVVNGFCDLDGCINFTVHSLTEILRKHGLPLLPISDTESLSQAGNDGVLGGPEGYFRHTNGSSGMVELNLIPAEAVAKVEANLLVAQRRLRRLSRTTKNIKAASSGKKKRTRYEYGAPLTTTNRRVFMSDLRDWMRTEDVEQRAKKAWLLYMKYGYEIVEKLTPYRKLQARMISAIDEVAEERGIRPEELTVLNVGMGPGFSEQAVVDRYHEAGVRMPKMVSFDYAPDVVHIAERRLLGHQDQAHSERSRITMFQADALSIPIASESVDVALSTNVLYILEPHRVVDAVYQMWDKLRSGGLMRFSLPRTTFQNSPIQREHFDDTGALRALVDMVRAAGKVTLVKRFNKDSIQADIATGRNLGLSNSSDGESVLRNVSETELLNIKDRLRQLDGVRSLGDDCTQFPDETRDLVVLAIEEMGFVVSKEELSKGGISSVSVSRDFFDEIRQRLNQPNLEILLEEAYSNQFAIITIRKL